jgi:hypothetical protein
VDTTAEEIEFSTEVVYGSGAIVCSAIVDGRLKRTTYYLVSKERAEEDFRMVLKTMTRIKEEA